MRFFFAFTFDCHCFLYLSLPGFRRHKIFTSNCFSSSSPPPIYSIPRIASFSLRIFDFNCFIAMSAPVALKVYPATPARYIESVHTAPGVVLNKEKTKRPSLRPPTIFSLNGKKSKKIAGFSTHITSLKYL